MLNSCVYDVDGDTDGVILRDGETEGVGVTDGDWVGETDGDTDGEGLGVRVPDEEGTTPQPSLITKSFTSLSERASG